MFALTANSIQAIDTIQKNRLTDSVMSDYVLSLFMLVWIHARVARTTPHHIRKLGQNIAGFALLASRPRTVILQGVPPSLTIRNNSLTETEVVC